MSPIMLIKVVIFNLYLQFIFMFAIEFALVKYYSYFTSDIKKI